MSSVEAHSSDMPQSSGILENNPGISGQGIDVQAYRATASVPFGKATGLGHEAP